VELLPLQKNNLFFCPTSSIMRASDNVDATLQDISMVPNIQTVVFTTPPPFEGWDLHGRS
jgi:hypothetical protein